MKKTISATNLLLVSTFFFAPYVFAANAALVSGIRDDAHLSMSITLDANPTSVFVYNGSLATTDDEFIPLALEVNGEKVRLELASSTESAIALPEITSEEVLSKYINELVRNNPKLASVVIKDNSIIMVRNTFGKLFGMFTLPVQETGEVTNWGDGTSAVHVSRPWWNMNSSQYTDGQITKDLYVRIKTIPSSLFVTDITANTQGRIITAIENTFSENNIDTTK